MNILPILLSHHTTLACAAAATAEDSADNTGSGNPSRRCPVCTPSRPSPHRIKDNADHRPYSFCCVGDSFSHHKVFPTIASIPIFALPGPHGIRFAPCETAFRPVLAMWTALYFLFVGFSSCAVFVVSGLFCNNISAILSVL